MELLSYSPAVPSPVQYRYHMQERIMFVHFAPNTWQGREYDDLSTPLSSINPEKTDTDQWCRAALLWGAKEILFVAKHAGGFCWWQTESSDYSVKNTPFRGGKGDLIAELAASCKKYGLNMGIYVYPGDAYFGAYLGGGGVTRDPALQEKYAKAYRTQLTEVLSRYGDMLEVWFDGSARLPIADIIEKYAKNCVILQSPHANIRWCGTENGATPYPSYNTISRAKLATGLSTARHSDPRGDVWADIECDVPLYTHNWFWSPENESKRKSVGQLVECYYKSVGRGAVMLLNSTPNTDGLIPDGDMNRYSEFGAELERRFAHPIIGKLELSDDSAAVYFGKELAVNHIRVAEDIRLGERVRGYNVLLRIGGEWRVVCSGSMIGACRIEVFETAEADAVKIEVTAAAATPCLREFSAYNVEDVDIGSLISSLSAPVDAYDQLRQSCGTYQAGHNTADLTAFVRFPGEYRIDFNFKGGSGNVSNVAGVLEGIRSEGIVEKLSDTAYILNRTAAVEDGCTTAVECDISDECEISVTPV
ncbi:MAG: alpha-L-fucosidase [Eubacteriales bacterium]